MEQMGVGVTFDNHTHWTFQAKELNMSYLQSDEFIDAVLAYEAPSCFLVRYSVGFSKASVAKPGGDKIGRRRLDTHFLRNQRTRCRLHLQRPNAADLRNTR